VSSFGPLLVHAVRRMSKTKAVSNFMEGQNTHRQVMQ